jgi:nitric oxide reductase NorQ protein
MVETRASIFTTEEYTVNELPFYRRIGDEEEIFRAAYHERLPVMLKGPTGCGKTRFLEYMAYELGQEEGHPKPLITIACHEDLTASDLVGRYLLEGGSTNWVDGPLTRSVRVGGICYLDEVVEARKDTTVLIHPLTDDRRVLPVEKRGEILKAPDEFILVISYNPGYQSVMKDLKQSTRQRFVAIEFNYPTADVEQEIVEHESGVDAETARRLVRLAEKTRNLKSFGLEEGVSTRLLVYAGSLIARGISPTLACEVALVQPITDDPEMQKSVREIARAVLG